MNPQMYEHLEKDIFNTGPQSSGTFPREKSNHSAEDVKFYGKITPDVSYGNHHREHLKPMEISQQPNTSNDAQSNEANMPEMDPLTPVSRNKASKNSPEFTDRIPTKPPRKRRAKVAEVRDSQNVHNSPKRPATLNGDSSSNEMAPYSPARVLTPNNACSSGFSPTNGVAASTATALSTVPREAHTQTETSEKPVSTVPETVDKAKYNEDLRTLKESLEESKKEVDKFKRKDLQKRKFLLDLMIKDTKLERQRVRDKIRNDNGLIGHFKPTGEILRHGCENWIDGTWKEDIDSRKSKLDNDKEELAAEIAALKKKKPVKDPRKTTEPVSDDGFLKPELPIVQDFEKFERRDEMLRFRKEYIKKEDAEITAEREKLDRERNLHIREIKRVQHEEDSIFNNYKLLNDQYLPIALLGKGGFSEVWRAFDLDACRNVACKIHRVNKHWHDHKKVNYVRHATREKDIHKSLIHPNIVQMFELFIIDAETFCTVLEYCDGNDLDFYLKQHGTLHEKETRLVISQVVDALRYLNEQKVPIIHYDLKPANILLQSGCRKFEIKITDFGLSKYVDTDEGDSIELTSQGAGTYWYLPPETFKGDNTKITPKVDIWSVGIICYQCIYGKRPFGHEQSQQRILSEGTILKANFVNFPPKPILQLPVQDFIRKCLQYEPSNRADVYELSKHEFIKSSSNKKTLSQLPASPSSRATRDEWEH